MIKYNANLDLDFSTTCSFTYDALKESIRSFNDENNENCCFQILKLIKEKKKNIDLNKFNDEENFRKNIIFYCLRVRNISALKYLIVDLKSKFPEKVFIDETVLHGFYGKMSLQEILKSKQFIFKKQKYVEKAKNEILDYLS